jgi:hypothetical protein
MNERLLIRLKQDGAPVQITSLSRDGVTLNAETDAWPRALTLEFDADSPVTRYRLERVRQLNDWGSWEYRLNLSLAGGALVVTGVGPHGLPAGRYWFRLRVADLQLPGGRVGVTLEEGGEAERELEVRADGRQVEVTLDDSGDAHVRRVLDHAWSRLDGQAARQWLTSAHPRASRKACLLNLLAKLRAASDGLSAGGAGGAGGPLLAHVEHVFFADVDRCYAAVTPALLARLDALAADPDKPFYAEGAPKAAIHRRLRDRIENFEPDAASYRLHSFRQEGKTCLQCVVASPPGDDASRRSYAEFDLDLGNPLQDLKGFFIHLGELLSPSRTDHLKLRDKLAKDARVRDYLYYHVVSE